MKKLIFIAYLFASSYNISFAQNSELIKKELINSTEDTYLKDFTFNIKPGEVFSTSLVLSKNTIYGFHFYQNEPNQLQFLINSDNTRNAEGGNILTLTGINKYKFNCEKTRVYHVNIKNLGKEKLESAFLLTFIDKIEDKTEVNEKNTKGKDQLLFSNIEDENYYFVVDKMPKFNGKKPKEFKEFIQKEIRYPKEASENNIYGKLFITFIVGKDGYIKKAKVARGIHPSLDQEALRVVYSSSRWEPGIKDGKPVDVMFTFPIVFKKPTE